MSRLWDAWSKVKEAGGELASSVSEWAKILVNDPWQVVSDIKQTAKENVADIKQAVQDNVIQPIQEQAKAWYNVSAKQEWDSLWERVIKDLTQWWLSLREWVSKIWDADTTNDWQWVWDLWQWLLKWATGLIWEPLRDVWEFVENKVSNFVDNELAITNDYYKDSNWLTQTTAKIPAMVIQWWWELVWSLLKLPSNISDLRWNLSQSLKWDENASGDLIETAEWLINWLSLWVYSFWKPLVYNAAKSVWSKVWWSWIGKKLISYADEWFDALAAAEWKWLIDKAISTVKSVVTAAWWWTATNLSLSMWWLTSWVGWEYLWRDTSILWWWDQTDLDNKIQTYQSLPSEEKQQWIKDNFKIDWVSDISSFNEKVDEYKKSSSKIIEDQVQKKSTVSNIFWYWNTKAWRITDDWSEDSKDNWYNLKVINDNIEILNQWLNGTKLVSDWVELSTEDIKKKLEEATQAKQEIEKEEKRKKYLGESFDFWLSKKQSSYIEVNDELRALWEKVQRSITRLEDAAYASDYKLEDKFIKAVNTQKELYRKIVDESIANPSKDVSNIKNEVLKQYWNIEWEWYIQQLSKEVNKDIPLLWSINQVLQDTQTLFNRKALSTNDNFSEWQWDSTSWMWIRWELTTSALARNATAIAATVVTNILWWKVLWKAIWSVEKKIDDYLDVAILKRLSKEWIEEWSDIAESIVRSRWIWWAPLNISKASKEALELDINKLVNRANNKRVLLNWIEDTLSEWVVEWFAYSIPDVMANYGKYDTQWVAISAWQEWIVWWALSLLLWVSRFWGHMSNLNTFVPASKSQTVSQIEAIKDFIKENPDTNIDINKINKDADLIAKAAMLEAVDKVWLDNDVVDTFISNISNWSTLFQLSNDEISKLKKNITVNENVDNNDRLQPINSSLSSIQKELIRWTTIFWLDTESVIFNWNTLKTNSEVIDSINKKLKTNFEYSAEFGNETFTSKQAILDNSRSVVRKREIKEWIVWWSNITLFERAKSLWMADYKIQQLENSWAMSIWVTSESAADAILYASLIASPTKYNIDLANKIYWWDSMKDSFEYQWVRPETVAAIKLWVQNIDQLGYPAKLKESVLNEISETELYKSNSVSPELIPAALLKYANFVKKRFGTVPVMQFITDMADAVIDSIYDVLWDNVDLDRWISRAQIAWMFNVMKSKWVSFERLVDIIVMWNEKYLQWIDALINRSQKEWPTKRVAEQVIWLLRQYGTLELSAKVKEKNITLANEEIRNRPFQSEEIVRTYDKLKNSLMWYWDVFLSELWKELDLEIILNSEVDFWEDTPFDWSSVENEIINQMTTEDLFNSNDYIKVSTLEHIKFMLDISWTQWVTLILKNKIWHIVDGAGNIRKEKIKSEDNKLFTGNKQQLWSVPTFKNRAIWFLEQWSFINPDVKVDNNSIITILKDFVSEEYWDISFNEIEWVVYPYLDNNELLSISSDPVKALNYLIELWIVNSEYWQRELAWWVTIRESNIVSTLVELWVSKNDAMFDLIGRIEWLDIWMLDSIVWELLDADISWKSLRNRLVLLEKETGSLFKAEIDFIRWVDSEFSKSIDKEKLRNSFKQGDTTSLDWEDKVIIEKEWFTKWKKRLDVNSLAIIQQVINWINTSWQINDWVWLIYLPMYNYLKWIYWDSSYLYQERIKNPENVNIALFKQKIVPVINESQKLTTLSYLNRQIPNQKIEPVKTDIDYDWLLRNNDVIVIEWPAWSGKTTVTTKFIKDWQKVLTLWAYHTVHQNSVDNIKEKWLKLKKLDNGTIASFLYWTEFERKILRDQSSFDYDTIIIDEKQMVEWIDVAKVIEIAKERWAKVIIVWDDTQVSLIRKDKRFNSMPDIKLEYIYRWEWTLINKWNNVVYHQINNWWSIMSDNKLIIPDVWDESFNIVDETTNIKDVFYSKALEYLYEPTNNVFSWEVESFILDKFWEDAFELWKKIEYNIARRWWKINKVILWEWNSYDSKLIKWAYDVVSKSIYLDKSNSDISTFVHEMAHSFEEVLTENERNQILDWSWDKKWSKETSEKFAKWFEKYVYDWSKRSWWIWDMFNRLSMYIKNVIDNYTSYFKWIELNTNMKQLYSRIVEWWYDRQTLKDTPLVISYTWAKWVNKINKALRQPKLQDWEPIFIIWAGNDPTIINRIEYVSWFELIWSNEYGKIYKTKKGTNVLILDEYNKNIWSNLSSKENFKQKIDVFNKTSNIQLDIDNTIIAYYWYSIVVEKANGMNIKNVILNNDVLEWIKPDIISKWYSAITRATDTITVIDNKDSYKRIPKTFFDKYMNWEKLWLEDISMSTKVIWQEKIVSRPAMEQEIAFNSSPDWLSADESYLEYIKDSYEPEIKRKDIFAVKISKTRAIEASVKEELEVNRQNWYGVLESYFNRMEQVDVEKMKLWDSNDWNNQKKIQWIKDAKEIMDKYNFWWNWFWDIRSIIKAHAWVTFWSEVVTNPSFINYETQYNNIKNMMDTDMNYILETLVKDADSFEDKQSIYKKFYLQWVKDISLDEYINNRLETIESTDNEEVDFAWWDVYDKIDLWEVDKTITIDWEVINITSPDVIKEVYWVKSMDDAWTVWLEILGKEYEQAILDLNEDSKTC